MGTDDLHHKRRAKNARDLQRKPVRRAVYKKILIVCEGKKTEPNYFADAREHYALSSVNVEVRGDSGSAPMSIVNFAKQRYREAKDAGDPYDAVYCVFDKDTHTTYAPALAAVAAFKPQGTFHAINSVPCFEYWLLLHFTYSTRPYNALPGNSSANQVLSELKHYIPAYAKNQSGLFIELVEQLERAKNNARRALQESQRNHSDNPSTRMHVLIEVLQHLKN